MKPRGDLVGYVAEIAAKNVGKKLWISDKADSQQDSSAQLSLWPKPLPASRAVPNSFLRSALFGVTVYKKSERPHLNRQRLPALNGLEVIYTGERLDQGDLNVYETIIHAMRLQAAGELQQITSYRLLMLMGLTDTGKNRDTLNERITRLVANAVEIKQGRYSYIGNLIVEANRDNKTSEWMFILNTKLYGLFAPDQFTYVDLAVRHELDRKPVALWLYRFYASHAKPYPMKVGTLQTLCGSTTKRLDHFRDLLRSSLDALEKASKEHGSAFSYSISGDLVYVNKTGSQSQQRHLSRKANRSQARRV